MHIERRLNDEKLQMEQTLQKKGRREWRQIAQRREGSREDCAEAVPQPF